MTPVIWAIVVSAAVLAAVIGLAAADICKRLDNIASILIRANDMTRENRTGEWRDR